MSRAACDVPNRDDWFAPPGTPQHNQAKATCLDCPLYWSCQEYALREGIPYGIWGGLDERGRERVWRKRGGRPDGFLRSMDAQVGPLLRARRLRESEEVA